MINIKQKTIKFSSKQYLVLIPANNTPAKRLWEPLSDTMLAYLICLAYLAFKTFQFHNWESKDIKTFLNTSVTEIKSRRNNE